MDKKLFVLLAFRGLCRLMFPVVKSLYYSLSRSSS